MAGKKKSKSGASMRQHYADQTGDTKNAFASKRDGLEGFEYSEDTLRRALDAYDDLDYDYERNRMSGLLGELGPRMGASAGQVPFPEGGRAYSVTRDALMNADQFRQLGDYGEMARRLGDAFMASQPINMMQNPAVTSMGILGALDFLREKYKKGDE